MSSKKIKFSLISVGLILAVAGVSPYIFGSLAKRILFNLAINVNQSNKNVSLKVEQFQLGYLQSNALLTVTQSNGNKLSALIHFSNIPYSDFNGKPIFGFVTKGQVPIESLKITANFAIALPLLHNQLQGYVTADNLDLTPNPTKSITIDQANLVFSGHYTNKRQIEDFNFTLTLNNPTLSNPSTNEKLTMQEMQLGAKVARLREGEYDIYPMLSAKDFTYVDPSVEGHLHFDALNFEGLRFNSKRSMNLAKMLQTQQNLSSFIPDLKYAVLSNNSLEINGFEFKFKRMDEPNAAKDFQIQFERLLVKDTQNPQGLNTEAYLSGFVVASQYTDMNLHLGDLKLDIDSKNLSDGSFDIIPTLQLDNSQIQIQDKGLSDKILGLGFTKLILGPLRFNTLMSKNFYAAIEACRNDNGKLPSAGCEFQQQLENVRAIFAFESYAFLPTTQFDLDNLLVSLPFGTIHGSVEQSYPGLPLNPTILDIDFSKQQKIDFNSDKIELPIYSDSTITFLSPSFKTNIKNLNGDCELSIPTYTTTGEHNIKLQEFKLGVHSKANMDFSDVAFSLQMALGNLQDGKNILAKDIKADFGLQHLNLKVLRDMLAKLNFDAEATQKNLTKEESDAIVLASAQDILNTNPEVDFNLEGSLLGAPVKVIAKLTPPENVSNQAKNITQLLLAMKDSQLTVNATISRQLTVLALNTINPSASYGFPHPALSAEKYLTQLERQGYIKGGNDTDHVDAIVKFNSITANGKPFDSLNKAEFYLQLGLYQEAYQLLRTLVTQNNPDVYYYLGVLEHHGLGCEKNPMGSELLFRKAAALGSKEAQKYLQH